MAPLSFLVVALALAYMHGALGAPSTPSVAPSSSLRRDEFSKIPIDTVSGDDIKAYLDAHNGIRSLHGANPLTWSTELSLMAQGRANECNFNTNSPYASGQNIALDRSDTSISYAVHSWAFESTFYDPDHPLRHGAWQFTQVVWKATTQLGCASAICPGPPESTDSSMTLYVCAYNPPGNIPSRKEFAQNVQVEKSAIR